MRVNVLHPMFLSDQHLVAEYREVKMGPKALSRSLGSLKGVDKKKISPVYTLNTGHTYFFYDKNTFLERRLEMLVIEMQFRGFQTNHLDLIDDSYDYHPNTFDPEWWNDWEPDVVAGEINLERINERFYQKMINPETRGWYKLFGYSVPDMYTLFQSRKNGYIHICPNCKSINEEKNEEIFCWNCCKKILPNEMEKIFLHKKEQKNLKIEEQIDENITTEEDGQLIFKSKDIESEFMAWSDLRLYKDWLIKNNYLIQEELIKVLKFTNNELNWGDEIFDEFDLEDLCSIIKLLISKINNKSEIIKVIVNTIKEENTKVFINKYFKKELE